MEKRERTVHTRRYDESREAGTNDPKPTVHVTAFKHVYSIDKVRSDVETKVEGEKTIYPG